MVLDLSDTIVAIATASGGAARGMIRLSGPDAVAITSRCFRGQTVTVREVALPQVVVGELQLGEVCLPVPCDLFLWPTASSYTRQPTAELHLIASPPLLELAVETLCRHGARQAEPGEFTLRAFLAGRLDLPQAEAVLGVIDATSGEALRTALCQLAGGLSKPLGVLREQLLVLLAHVEAGLDFVDEDIEFISAADVQHQLSAAQELVAATLWQLQSRGSPQSLPKVVLVGEPNAGKSSLFNALVERFGVSVERSRALVSQQAGTTRDYLSAVTELAGVTCELVDTAGVEITFAEGIPGQAQEMTSRQQRQADCRVWCVDITASTVRDQVNTFAGQQATILAVTKVDLRPDAFDLYDPHVWLSCSSKTGVGLEQLAIAIGAVVGEQETPPAVASTVARCFDSLIRAQESLQSALTLVLAKGGDELIAAEIRNSLLELGRVVGAVCTDDILDRIFSQFCIGK